MNPFLIHARLMAPEGEPGGGGGPAAQPPTPLAAAPPAPPAPPAGPQAAPPAAPTPPTVPERDRVSARLRQEERQKGRRAAMAELEMEAKKAGFVSHAEMQAFAFEQRRGKPATPPAPAPEQIPAQAQGLSPETVKAEARRRRMAKRLLHETRARREAERRITAREAEMELREVAIRAGVRDVDYAIAILRRHLSSQTKAQLAAFDETKWFEELRGTRAYLFGEREQPASTSPAASAAGAPPAPPAAGPVKTDDANAGQIDAKKMSRAEYIEHLRKKGLNVPDAGLSY